MSAGDPDSLSNVNLISFDDQEQKKLKEIQAAVNGNRQTIRDCSDRAGILQQMFWDEIFRMRPDLKGHELHFFNSINGISVLDCDKIDALHTHIMAAYKEAVATQRYEVAALIKQAEDLLKSESGATDNKTNSDLVQGGA